VLKMYISHVILL